MKGQERLDAPEPGELWAPEEWITTRGEVKWYARAPKQKCEDCLHCILDDLNGRRPEGFGPPGLAQYAKKTRSQGGEEHIFCRGHAAMRQAKEEAHG